MKKLVLILSFSFISVTSLAKRTTPAEIKPVLDQGNEFSFRIEQSPCKKGEVCGMQVFLTSKNLASGKINWEKDLYQKLFDPDLEIDVQTIFPRSMKLNKKQLVVIDEQGSKYIVKAQTGDLIDPLKSIIYPAKKR